MTTFLILIPPHRFVFHIDNMARQSEKRNRRILFRRIFMRKMKNDGICFYFRFRIPQPGGDWYISSLSPRSDTEKFGVNSPKKLRGISEKDVFPAG